MTSTHIPDDRRDRVRQAADQRCGYCISPQHLVLGQLEIDHLQPTACGGTDEEDNLWLACRLCNNAKSAQTECRDPITGQLVPLFNPRRQSWLEHFVSSDDGTRILGKITTINWSPLGLARRW